MERGTGFCYNYAWELSLGDMQKMVSVSNNNKKLGLDGSQQTRIQTLLAKYHHKVSDELKNKQKRKVMKWDLTAGNRGRN